MSDNNSSSAGGGISLCSLVFIVFLVLKLCKVINWSWWWVTSPLWIPLTLGIVVILIVFIIKLFKILKK